MSQQCFDERLDATSDSPPAAVCQQRSSFLCIHRAADMQRRQKKKNLQNVFGDGREEKKKKTNPVTVRHWVAIKSVSQAAPRTLRHAHPLPPPPAAARHVRSTRRRVCRLAPKKNK